MSSPRPRVLCVDDNEDMSLMIVTMLDGAGYEVVSASSVAETLRRAGSEEFDLYLLDHRLPDGTGAELCRRLTELAPQKPVVIFSGSAMDEERRRGMEAGARAYLIKPNDLDRLVATVGSLLGGGGGRLG